MKAAIRTLLSSRKLVLVSVTVLLVGAATSAAALFVGKDRILGRSYGSANGFSCESVQTVNVRKNGALWVRKYIRMDEAEGIDRIKTALRVASVVYADYKPDLVQVTVLDQNGPIMRSNMRGRAIAAQVVYIPDPSKLPDDATSLRFNAYYHDGSASADGMYYGLRIDVPTEEMELLALAQDKFIDCKNPEEAPLLGQGKSKSERPVPANLGTVKPEQPKQSGPSDSDGEQGLDEDLSDLIAANNMTEQPSVFSLAYYRTLLFGNSSSTDSAQQ